MARLRPYAPLLLIVVAAFVLRLAVIHEVRPDCADGTQGITGECWELKGDTHYVAVQAQYLNDGHGFIDSSAVVFGADETRPGAAHPPMFTVFLAVLDRLGFDRPGWWRAASALTGSIGAGLIALAAWRLAGDREHTTGGCSRTVAIIAGVIAVFDPLLWSRDADLLVESLVIPLMALVVLAALRLWRRPSFASAAWLGAAIGASFLTRSELLALLPCMAPLFWGLRTQTARRRLGLFALAGAIAVTMMAPWVLYNMRRFEHPVYVSTNLGMAEQLGACDATYYGNDFGYWTFDCVAPVDTSTAGDDSEAERRLSASARAYVGAHAGRTPVTMLARAARFWGIYQPADTVARWADQEKEGALAARAGFVALVVLVPFAVVGAWELRRRRTPVSPLVAPIIVATVAATLLIPIPRFRVAADVTIVIMAAMGIDMAWRRFRRRDPGANEPRHRPEGDPAASPAEPTGEAAVNERASSP